MQESIASNVVAPLKRAPGPAAARRTTERGRSHGLPLIFWLLEQRVALLLAVPFGTAVIVGLATRGPWWVYGLALLATPLVGIVLPLGYLIYRSYRHDGGSANCDDVIVWRDAKSAERWRGKKIPITVVYEAYIAGELELIGDLRQALLRRNLLFRFCFTWADIRFYFLQFFGQNLNHSRRADRADIAPVYDRGNDFYGWFLGPSMVYTGAIFRSESESLEVAQARKLDTICRYVHMKPGDRHLDIGCGWGALLVHAAEHYGTLSTGITLAKEQAVWAREHALRQRVADRVEVRVEDYRSLSGVRFDKVTCVEMAEHVGIRNFQKFLLQVRGLLEDDGIFYLQIAGLRRAWQYEDFVWGLFMAKYVFPGADASCPLGFVVSQAERAGFEVHRVENTGSHYAVTIQKWLENWESNESAIVAAYGKRWFRLWRMFLAWSVHIGGQGSSALFMLTLTKNTKNDQSTVSAEEAKGQAFSRRRRWIGSAPIETQQ